MCVKSVLDGIACPLKDYGFTPGYAGVRQALGGSCPAEAVHQLHLFFYFSQTLPCLNSLHEIVHKHPWTIDGTTPTIGLRPQSCH